MKVSEFCLMSGIQLSGWSHNWFTSILLKIAPYAFKRNIEARSRNKFCIRQIINIVYSECLPVALIILHAKCMHIIILSSVTYLILPHSYTLSHN